MNDINRTTYLPSRMESKDLADYWRDKYTEVVNKLARYKNETAITDRKLRKWKFYFFSLITVEVAVLIFFLIK